MPPHGRRGPSRIHVPKSRTSRSHLANHGDDAEKTRRWNPRTPRRVKQCQCSWYSLAILLHQARILPDRDISTSCLMSFSKGFDTIVWLSSESNGLALLASDRNLRQAYTDGEGDTAYLNLVGLATSSFRIALLD
ncbi:hypothetical protein KCU62_g484, partial [Aureobasidium sp. EXF-3399]